MHAAAQHRHGEAFVYAYVLEGPVRSQLDDTRQHIPLRREIHNEPTEPVPYYERGIMLREFPAEAQDKLIKLVGPDSDTTMWIVELHALGGAWDREPEVPNAVASRGPAVRPVGRRGRSAVAVATA